MIPNNQFYFNNKGTMNHAYFKNLCALLEPLALEPIQGGVFSYAISSSETKYMVASFLTRLNGAGRTETRSILRPMALSGVTLQGTESLKSCAAVLNPDLVSANNYFTAYYDNLKYIDEADIKQITFEDPVTYIPMLPGAYGAIIVNITMIDMTWVATYINSGGYNLNDEIDDVETQRYGINIKFPVSKYTINSLISGNENLIIPTQPPIATVSYVLLPASYGHVPDNNTYLFRDDFMGSSLDMSVWEITRSQASSMQIDLQYNWVKMIGTSSWTTNTMYSKSNITKQVGIYFLIDIFFNNNSAGTMPGGAVGWHDGLGNDYTNFAYGLNFATSTSTQGTIAVLENGNLYATGFTYSQGNSYRIKITLQSVGAKYEIQGGSEYGSLGGTQWNDITPVQSSATTSVLRVGASAFYNAKNIWISDMRVVSP